ncbi:MAG: hypothetical protein GWN32_05810 [Gemmatimonadetes bacterium]|nr:hypothetical protein [Gemmatimonadota bacterium]
MVSSTVLTLVVIPSVYLIWRRWQVKRAARVVPVEELAPSRSEPAHAT